MNSFSNEDEVLSSSSRDQYQRIYETFEWYGNAEEDRCPGVRLIPMYESWLRSPLLDLGCGRGHTVEELRRRGFTCEGIDQVDLANGMRVGDICRPIPDMHRFESVLCIDCIEHLPDAQVSCLFDNMKRVEHQAFSIHNGESKGTGEELHVNRKPFEEWEEWIGSAFVIEEIVPVNRQQKLYLTRRA